MAGVLAFIPMVVGVALIITVRLYTLTLYYGVPALGILVLLRELL